MYLQLDGNGATYEQLARAIQAAIRKGRIPAGGKLLPSRELASQLKVSRNTVVSAYELLCSQRWTRSRLGSGTYVLRVPEQPVRVRDRDVIPPQSRYSSLLRSTPPGFPGSRMLQVRYDLQYGHPMVNAALPRTWRSHLLRAVRESTLDYPMVQGLPELREEICRYLARRRGFVCSPRNVIIVGGTQQAMALALRVLVDEGDVAVIEDPCYKLVSDAVRAHGARIISVPVDDQGLVCSELPAVRPSLICVSPSHQFPSGAIMSQPRREELLRYAMKHSSWIIEDDYDGEFRYDTAPIPALRSLDAGERVLYVGSFSKTLFPGMRLGYIVCPAGLLEDVRRAKRYDDLGCAGIEQQALATFMHSGAFERHLRKVMLELRNRRAALIGALRRHCPEARINDSRSGMHMVAWLPHFTYQQLDALLLATHRRSLGVRPIHAYYANPPTTPGLLLGVASLSAAQLRVSARLLGEAIAEVRAREA
ncbi:MAG TPA: PLP-dependent aminotransferase family protein [Steroidobacteraceae bacterium]|nr:PLP-dependent aminotransferase family protein [Steroidobacteraceae bacterium]